MNDEQMIEDELIDDTDQLATARTLVNSSQHEPYVPVADTSYRAGSMDYKTVPSRGIA